MRQVAIPCRPQKTFTLFVLDVPDDLPVEDVRHSLYRFNSVVEVVRLVIHYPGEKPTDGMPSFEIIMRFCVHNTALFTLQFCVHCWFWFAIYMHCAHSISTASPYATRSSLHERVQRNITPLF